MTAHEAYKKAEDELEDKQDSFSVGTAGKGCALKFYFNLDDPLETLIPLSKEEAEERKNLTKMQKALEVCNYFSLKGLLKKE